MTKSKYYVVWQGRRTGIFTSWAECSAQVIGYTNAQYKAFANRESAETAFHSSYEEYMGKRVPTLTSAELEAIGRPIADSYSVDSACSGYPGPLDYRCVHTTTHRLIFRQGPFENGSNNVGEFLAIVHALALFKKRGLSQPIYTDSDIAMRWIKGKKCKTKLPRDEQNSRLFELIARAEEWMAVNEYVNPILKWNTDAWGEIPADYGRK